MGSRYFRKAQGSCAVCSNRTAAAGRLSARAIIVALSATQEGAGFGQIAQRGSVAGGRVPDATKIVSCRLLSERVEQRSEHFIVRADYVRTGFRQH